MEKEHCNEQNCTCPKITCPRHGKCCECIMNHRGNGSLVYCMRDIAEKLIFWLSDSIISSHYFFEVFFSFI